MQATCALDYRYYKHYLVSYIYYTYIIVNNVYKLVSLIKKFTYCHNFTLEYKTYTQQTFFTRNAYSRVFQRRLACINAFFSVVPLFLTYLTAYLEAPAKKPW